MFVTVMVLIALVPLIPISRLFKDLAIVGAYFLGFLGS